MKKTWMHWLRAAVVGAGLLFGALAVGHSAQAATGSTVGTVNYVQNYGIALYEQPGAHVLNKFLKTGTRWQVFAGAAAGNDYYFNLGGKQYMSGKYFDIQNESSTQALRAVGRVKYVPGYSIAIWTKATSGQKPVPGRKLLHNSAWRVNRRQVVNGHVWYELGTNQWIDGTYFYLTSEQSRGTKQYATAPEDLVKPGNNSGNNNNGGSVTPPSTAHPDSQTVYVAASGKKYHFITNCVGLSNADKGKLRTMTLAQARAKGYTQCNLEK
ncbi:hypothetical protein [Schleiferilactobacillus shenzhenensis]|uniref:Surface layer protein A domain-containing protein n=1 Tax=Schleiferilactobacillus shenzhenensis LY-73 TaxID=1231336 RepID=U4TUU0_9LACO|nr:hypothetical protein [Schleiferilactobacillus shenzhenensis]ERL65192.1 hypothetical protein L248_2867 [Schleiferilactobacillus shenzhenensis LY-73]